LQYVDVIPFDMLAAPGAHTYATASDMQLRQTLLDAFAYPKPTTDDDDQYRIALLHIPSQVLTDQDVADRIRLDMQKRARKEVDACYRKRQLEQHLDDNPRRQRQRLDTRKRSRSQDRRPPSRDITASDHVHEREFWAARKALKSQAILDKVGDRMCSVDNAPAYESDEKAAKKHKKRAKKAQKKLKKLKKKRKAD
ncbi:hypothetical protein DYB28_012020, partial [Aphanomyces astaci]